jgi:hypothetical protein
MRLLNVGRVKRSVPAKPSARNILPALALLVSATNYRGQCNVQ